MPSSEGERFAVAPRVGAAGDMPRGDAPGEAMRRGGARGTSMPRGDARREDIPHAIVVGAGLGGLAAAIRLRALGCDVTVVERLSEAGGRARVFRQDGFVFDAGPTVITAPHMIDALFAVLGERRDAHLRFLPVRPWYRILFSSGRRFDYGSSADEMERAVAAFAPADVVGYRRLRRRAAALFRIGFERFGAVPFHRPSTMARALPHLVRLGAFRSLHGMVAGCLRDPELRQAFTLQTLLVGGHPFRTSAIYGLIGHLELLWGVWFAEGGTGKLVASLVDLASRHGVAFRFGETVRRIAVEDGAVRGVVLADGTMLGASIVVANADAPVVHRELLGRRPWRRQALSMGLFVLCFGTDRTWPEIAHHTILIGPDYKASLDAIFDGADAPPAAPSLYLHRPTATDPDAAPPGTDAFYVLAPVPNLRSPIDWPRVGEAFRDRIVAALETRLMPGLSRHIVTERVVTPVDFARDFLSEAGAGFSVAPLLQQSAGLRFHNRVARADGLYLVGAGTHPGAGVPGVLTSAVIVETLVRDRLVRADRRLSLATLSRHGRSFRLAGRLLPGDTLGDAAVLYRFCRTVDDLADLAPDRARARARLEALRAAVLADERADADARPLLALAGRRGLDLAPAVALIDTMIADLDPLPIASIDALLAYAQGAAGTVGLLMSDLLTGGDARARPFAADLGIAMQLTNIARDVAEDAGRGRVFLPVAWLGDAAATPAAVLDGANRDAVFAAVEAALALADRHYRRAEAGYRFLPVRSRAAIRAAGRLYQEIGRLVRRRGPAGLGGARAVVGTGRRFALLALALPGRPGPPAPAGGIETRRPAAPAAADVGPRPALCVGDGLEHGGGVGLDHFAERHSVAPDEDGVVAEHEAGRLRAR